ncbi:MAG TPA: methylmalonyl-CoA mutase family protein, partial [Myxococcales bacterium]|nr:methylmalonyl-CoA mutase family protein [Myxococcales bacterium]
RALAYIARIDEMGGMLRAVEEGYPQKEIAESAYRHQREVEAGDRVIVGVNRFAQEGAAEIPTLKIDEAVTRHQLARLAKVKRERDGAAVARTLRGVAEACRTGFNLVEPVLQAVKAYATLGEICDVFRAEFGTYREAGSF